MCFPPFVKGLRREQCVSPPFFKGGGACGACWGDFFTINDQAMKQLLLTILLFCTCCTCQALAGTTQVKEMRLWDSPDGTRLVFDLNQQVEYRLFTLHNPERVVIDLQEAELKFDPQKLQLQQSLIESIRVGNPKPGRLRIVLDLQTVLLPKSFSLKPNDQYGHRLVVDLNKPQPAADAKALAPVRAVANLAVRDFIIAIDAGHGGEDPGALGSRGTKEKNVVLAIARKLAKRIDNVPGMKAFLVRDGDYYVSLRQRIAKARAHQSDLFISIHADAFRDSRARGASIYTLSTHGASNEAARWLADRENNSDLIGGISLDDKDDVLAQVLLDLSQTASSEASLHAGSKVLSQIRGLVKLHSPRVQQAGFAVLKSPDIPSILVETGFISNRTEERQLLSTAFQNKMAYAIANGVKAYLKGKPKPRVLPNSLKVKDVEYRVKRGDTLSKIAGRHRTSVQQLQILNRMQSDRIVIGQVLHLPTTG